MRLPQADIFMTTGLNTELTPHDLKLRSGVPVEAPFLGVQSLLATLGRRGLGHRTRFCDPYNWRLTTEEVVDRAVAASPRIVAVSALYDQWDRGFTSIPVQGTRHLLVRLRQELPEVWILFGGRAASPSTVDEILQAGADAVFLGESDHSFPMVVERLLQGEGILEATRAFPGISARMGRQVHRDLDIPLVPDLATIPPPRTTRLGANLFLHDQRGCLSSCTYCSARMNLQVAGRSVIRYFDLDELKREIAAHERAKPLGQIFLTANTFFSDRRRGWDLAAWLLDNTSAVVACTIRPEDLLNPWLQEHLAHLTQPERLDLAMGLESLSPRILRLYGRQIEPERLLSLVRQLHAMGFTNLTLFYIGIDPFRSPDDLKKERDTLFSLADDPALLLQTIWQMEEFSRHLVFYPDTPLQKLARPYAPWQLAYKYLMEPLALFRHGLPKKLAPLLDKAQRSSLPAPLKARMLKTLFPPILDWLERFFDSAMEAAANWKEETVLSPSLSTQSHHLPNKAYSILLSSQLYGSDSPFTDSFARILTKRYAMLGELGIKSPLKPVADALTDLTQLF